MNSRGDFRSRGRRRGDPSSVAAPDDANADRADAWLKYEHKLSADVPPASLQSQLDKMRGAFGMTTIGTRRVEPGGSKAAGPDDGEEGNADDSTSPMTATQRLRRKLERILSLSGDDMLVQNPLDSDAFIADAYGVGDAMPPASDWIAWAMDLAENYPERTKKLADELESGFRINEHVLRTLESETREGYCGSRTYICALNYLLHDSFARCALSLPPGINFKIAVDLRGGDPLYKAQMRSWRGYQIRVFGIIGIINRSIGQGNGPGNQALDEYLPEILCSKKLAPMSAQITRFLKRDESEYPLESCSNDEFNDHIFYKSSGLNGQRGNNYFSGEDGLGESNYFDRLQIPAYGYCGDESSDFDDSDNSQGSDKQKVEDPYRLEGVQFYRDGRYSSRNKCEVSIKLESAENGKEYCNEAIPDIALRAKEGNLAAVRKIVDAAAAVGDHEKRATVNKARRWIKLNYNKTKFCELYDGTPLVYACLNGHHGVVQYLLEHGADPTLRGTIPPSWSVNARGAVYKLYGKIERGEFPYPDSLAMKKCGERCEELLFAVRPFWRTAVYCGDSCYGNERNVLSNVPTDVGSMRLALSSVSAMDDHLLHPLKQIRPSDHRKNPLNRFTSEKITRDQSVAAQAPSMFAFGRLSAAEVEYKQKKICLVCYRKKSLHCFAVNSNQCIDCCQMKKEEKGGEKIESSGSEYYSAIDDVPSEYCEEDYCADKDQPDCSGDESCAYADQWKYGNQQDEEFYEKEGSCNNDELEYDEDDYFADEDQPDFTGDESSACEIQSEDSNEEEEDNYEDEGGDYINNHSGHSADEYFENETQTECSESGGNINEENGEYSQSQEYDEEGHYQSGSSAENICDQSELSNAENRAYSGSSASDAEVKRKAGVDLAPMTNTFFFGKSSQTSGLVTPSPNSAPASRGFLTTSAAGAVGSDGDGGFNIGVGDINRVPMAKSSANKNVCNVGHRRIVKARRPSAMKS